MSIEEISCLIALVFLLLVRELGMVQLQNLRQFENFCGSSAFLRHCLLRHWSWAECNHFHRKSSKISFYTEFFLDYYF